MDADRVAGAAERLQGRAETVAGRAVGDTKLQVEGHADQVRGAARNAAGDARDAAREASDDPQAEVEQLRAQVNRLAAEPATPKLDAVARTAERYDRELDHYLDRSLGVIRERPLAALGAAALAGFLVGRFISGNSYVYRV